jgi:hypothetical protein
MNKYNSPISLQHITHIIDRVSDRYPLLTKYETTLIIKSIFEVMRDIIISGDQLSFNSFFSHMHLLSFNRMTKKKLVRMVRVKLTTPESLKTWMK